MEDWAQELGEIVEEEGFEKLISRKGAVEGGEAVERVSGI